MIPQRNISVLSTRLAAGGGLRIREDVLERDYCLVWLLNALATSDLQPVLAFKAGTALKRCYFADYRFSEDLDFTLREAPSFDDIRARLEPVYAAVQEQSGILFTFGRQDPRVRANTHTFYLRFTGPLPGSNDVKVDITIEERLSFPLEERPVLRGYPEFADLPENRPILVYFLNEIAAEKTVALTDSARNEPRDLYDLWYLTENDEVQLDHIIPAIVKNWNSAKHRAKVCKPRSHTRKGGYALFGTLGSPTRWPLSRPLNRSFARCAGIFVKPSCPDPFYLRAKSVTRVYRKDLCLERVLFVVGSRHSGKSTQLRSSDVHLGTYGKIPKQRKPDFAPRTERIPRLR